MELWGVEQQGHSLPPATNTPQIKALFSLCQSPLVLLPPHPRASFLCCLSPARKPREQQAREAVCQGPPALVGIFMRDLFSLSCCFVSRPLGCLLAVGVCWNQNWRKPLGIHPGNKRAFVQEDLEDVATFFVATFISGFSLPRSTCQQPPRRWVAVHAWGGHMGRRMDTSCACRQQKWSTAGRRLECFPNVHAPWPAKLNPSLTAKLHALCPGSARGVGWALLLIAATAP